MRTDVAFTPAELEPAPVAVVVDVLRATSTIAQAIAGGYERVLCAAEIEQALALRAAVPDALVGGERSAVKVPEFDVGASPREFLEARAATLVLSTTNGTQAILSAAEACRDVLLGSLLNLDAVARAAAARGRDVTIVCAGFKGRFALDDAYCAGRIAERLGGKPSDATLAALAVCRSYATPLEALRARTYGPPGLEEDIAWCARQNVLDVVPAFSGMVDGAAEIRREEKASARRT